MPRKGGGAGPPYFYIKLRSERSKKKLFGQRPGRPPSSQGLDDRPPPALSEGLDPALNQVTPYSGFQAPGMILGFLGVFKFRDFLR